MSVLEITLIKFIGMISIIIGIGILLIALLHGKKYVIIYHKKFFQLQFLKSNIRTVEIDNFELKIILTKYTIIIHSYNKIYLDKIYNIIFDKCNSKFGFCVNINENIANILILNDGWKISNEK